MRAALLGDLELSVVSQASDGLALLVEPKHSLLAGQDVTVKPVVIPALECLLDDTDVAAMDPDDPVLLVIVVAAQADALCAVFVDPLRVDSI